MNSFPSLRLCVCRISCSSRRSGRPTSAVPCFHNSKEKKRGNNSVGARMFCSYAFIVYLPCFSIVSMSDYHFLQPDQYEWMNWILDVQQLFYRTFQTQWFIPAAIRPYCQTVCRFLFSFISYFKRIYLQLRFNIKPFMSHFGDKRVCLNVLHQHVCHAQVVSPKVLNAEAVAMLVHHESLEWNLSELRLDFLKI